MNSQPGVNSNPQPQPPNPNQNIDHPKNSDKLDNSNPHTQKLDNTDQNIEQQIADLANWIMTADYNARELRVEIKQLVSKQVNEARKDEVVLLSAFTPDDSEWAHEYIEDRLAELRQTPPTPNGDEQGGLTKSEEAKSE